MSKTAIEKFGDMGRKAAGVIEIGRKNLQKIHVPKTAKFPRKAQDWEEGVMWLAQRLMQTGKVTGVSLLWLTEYLIRSMNAILVDNKILRGLEDITEKTARGAEKKVDKKTGRRRGETAMSKFSKNNPWVWAYLTYYASLLGLVVGGVTVADNIKNDSKDSDKKTPKKEVIDGVKGEGVSPTVDAEIKTISADNPQFIENAFDEYFPYIAVGITEMETYRESPKVHSGESRETNGWGCTWFYSYDNNGNIQQEPNRVGKTKTLSKEQNFRQLQMHLKHETLKTLKHAVRGKPNIDARQQIALIYAGYQRPADVSNIVTRLEKAVNNQQIADAFLYYGGAAKWKAGTLKRRWWCAAYAVGAISTKDFLDLPRDAFSMINLNNVYRNGHFLMTPEVVKYALNAAKRGSKSTVRDFLSDFDAGREVLGVVDQGRDVVWLESERVESDNNDVINESMKKLNEAEKAFKNKNYKEAEKLYLKAIDIDKDNMETYSSLALTYKKLGDENHSIEYYEKSLQTVVQANARMNANKDLLLDREIKAASYYNAGLVREEMAKIYESQKDFAKAKENYKKAAANFDTAIENIQMLEVGGEKISIYQNAKSRALNCFDRLGEKSKVTAFNNAADLIREHGGQQQNVKLYNNLLGVNHNDLG